MADDQKASSGSATGTIRIQWYRSSIGRAKSQKILVSSLGLTKLNQVVVRPDTAAMRGAVRKAPHLLRILKDGE